MPRRTRPQPGSVASGLLGRDRFGLVLALVQAPPAAAGKFPELLRRPRRPVHRHAVGLTGAAEADQQPAVAGGQVAAAAQDEMHLAGGAALDLDAGADGVAVALLAVADQF